MRHELHQHGEMGKFMSSPEEMQWDKDNGAVYKAYLMEEMGG